MPSGDSSEPAPTEAVTVPSGGSHRDRGAAGGGATVGSGDDPVDHVSGAEVLDSTVPTTTARGWIALLAVMVILLAILVWSFVATVPRQTKTTAAVVQPGAPHHVVAGATGAVTVSVADGTTVTKGQPVGSVQVLGEGAPVPTTSTPSLVTVTAPIGGVVHDIRVSDGQGVDATRTIMTIDPEVTEPLRHLVTYLGTPQVELFVPGMTVQVSITDVGRRSTTAVSATVLTVADVPSSPEAMEATLQSNALAQKLRDATDGPVYRVDLQIDDPAAIPPGSRLQQGEVVDVVNTYSNAHPINLLFDEG